MKIKRFEVMGLFGRENTLIADLHDDLNILTGRNGAGKTTILKLLWYIISGNILIALREVSFKKAILVTDKYEFTINKLTRMTCAIDLRIGDETYRFEDLTDDDGDIFENAEDAANTMLLEIGASSVFFPTFRRIEGGFTLENSGVTARNSRLKNDVEESLLALSRKLTHEPHVFVSAISTGDIVGLLLRQYSDLSEISNTLQQDTSQRIIETIKDYKSDPGDVKLATANHVLDTIRENIEQMEVEREKIMLPMQAVKDQVEKLFKHTGIKFGNRLSFGDAASAVNSDSLSAGEKQLLSFICYNAFYKNSIIFIDEPELSLHVDWQRQIFPILQKQQSSNQFIIATHSPFIYSKYPEKEVVIDPNRGDRGEQE